jgi:hypothetical protein
MAAINKNFVIKNGVEIGDNLIYGNKDQLRVGVGTTVPGYTLDVRGGIGATSVSVGQTITANAGIITTVQASNLTVGSGLNFNSGIGTNLNVSGVATVGSLSIGSNQVISSGRQLQNIASLDATTTATIEAAIANGPNTFTDLIITGISTFNSDVGVAGIVTAPAVRTSWVQVGSGLTFTTGIGTNLSITGMTTSGSLNVTGFGTIGNIAFRSTGSSGGIITSTDNVGIITYYGDGSQLSGIGGAPGGAGANTQVVYNSAGSFAGSSNFTFDGSNVSVSGIVTAQDFNSLSDFRYKTDIHSVTNALSKINDLRGVRFNWKESGLPSYGVVAQELEQILPELVHGNDPKTVNYNGIIGVLIEAIKELKAEIEELKKYK